MRVRACLWAVAVVMVLTGCTGGLPIPFQPPDNTPIVATPAPPPVVLLQVGDCTGQADSGAYNELQEAACDRPHYYEVVALLPLAGEDWPGFDAVSSAAERGCPGVFTAYVGVPSGTSLYTTSAVVPTQADWRSPDNRTIACLAGTDGGGLVGSVRGDTRLLPSAGQCIGSIRGEKLSLIECSRRHTYEVFAERALGTGESNAGQDRFCRERFAAFVGIPARRSRYFMGELGTMTSWSPSDKRVICVAGPVDGIGTLKGSRT